MGSVVISGATSGAVTLAVPAEAGTRTLTLPATTGTVLTNDISAAGDTSAGDAAAIGYTAAEGLILTGQGSTSDVTIKNDADVTVMSIPTGTTHVAMGQINAASGSKIYTVGSGTYELDIAGALTLSSGRDNGASMLFEVSNSEKMRIDAAGNVGIGLTPSGAKAYVKNTTASQAGLIVENNVASYSSALIAHVATSGTRYLVDFRIGGTAGGNQQGTITSTGSGVAYNTSSDYRLKENVSYSFDATTRIKQLKPARFNFITDADKTVDGFLAHEVSSIVPEAVTGTKDGMKPEVLYVEGDELPDGKSVGDVKEASAPDYQGIDQSKLVPLLVKTIQELEARITALEA